MACACLCLADEFPWSQQLSPESLRLGALRQTDLPDPRAVLSALTTSANMQILHML